MRRLVYVRKDAVHVDDLRHKTRHMWDRVGILVADRKVICSGRCTGSRGLGRVVPTSSQDCRPLQVVVWS